MLMIVLVIFICLHVVLGQIPCDDWYGQYCPSASGFEVGECLKQYTNELSDACKQFINIHDACQGDIQANCPGQEYTGDTLGKYLLSVPKNNIA
jgi:hypothetical protein